MLRKESKTSRSQKGGGRADREACRADVPIRNPASMSRFRRNGNRLTIRLKRRWKIGTQAGRQESCRSGCVRLGRVRCERLGLHERHAGKDRQGVAHASHQRTAARRMGQGSSRTPHARRLSLHRIAPPDARSSPVRRRQPWGCSSPDGYFEQVLLAIVLRTAGQTGGRVNHFHNANAEKLSGRYTLVKPKLKMIWKPGSVVLSVAMLASCGDDSGGGGHERAIGGLNIVAVMYLNEPQRTIRDLSDEIAAVTPSV